jgi:hypothetical protein
LQIVLHGLKEKDLFLSETDEKNGLTDSGGVAAGV